MKEVFLLHHTYGESESESYKLLGVFDSEAKANSQIENYTALPGFSEYPEGFTVSRYIIDEPQWLGGFGDAKKDSIEDKKT